MDDLDSAPTEPEAATLNQLADYIGDVINLGNDSQRKALTKALIANITITGPGTFVPYYRIPQQQTEATTEETAPAEAETSTDAVRPLRHLVDLLEALSYPCPRVWRLLDRANDWTVTKSPGDSQLIESTPSFQPRQQRPLPDLLGEDGVQTLIASFRAGQTRRALATQYSTSLSSVERLLRARGVRRRTQALVKAPA